MSESDRYLFLVKLQMIDDVNEYIKAVRNARH